MRIINALTISFFVSITGCRFTEGDTKIQYVPDMADAPTVKPQEDFLRPPKHSLTTDAFLYPETPDEAEQLLKNPITSPTEADLLVGENMYNTFCLPCHGPEAKGNNSLGGVYPQPPSLLDAVYADRGDGYWFHRITFGAAIMPAYGARIDIKERWQLIHYLRKIQGKL